MKTVIVTNLIDWSESFVDKNGTFYCGTTEEQKKNATRIAELSDLVIDTTDIHPVTAPEHNINKGLYPVHNAVLPEQYGPDFVYSITPDGKQLKLGDKTLSPRLTKVIAEALKKRNRGILTPRGVYFQARLDNAFITPNEIEETFKVKLIEREDFIRGDFDWITAPKQYFDATRIDSDVSLPKVEFPRIPNTNYNVYSLLDQKFPRSEYQRVFINTGVVEGICRLHTSIGLRQMFPFDRIINVEDATTPLFGVELGYKTAEESREACIRVCKDIGIEYKTTEEVLREISNLGIKQREEKL